MANPMQYLPMMRRRGINPCTYVPGLYSQAEVDDLINIDGYVPVADAAEIQKISSGASETMGGCSIWAGTYTTGLDKKYIQIFDIELGNYTPAMVSFNGIYDGNEKLLFDGTFDASGNNNGFIGGSTDVSYEARNIIFENCSNPSALLQTSILGRAASSSCVIENIKFLNCSKPNRNIETGLAIVIITADIVRNILVKDCTANCAMISLVGEAVVDLEDIRFENCTITDATLSFAAIAGNLASSTAQRISAINCSFTARSTTTINNCGILFGVIRSTSTVKEVYVKDSDLTITNGGMHHGGVVGLLDGILEDSYAENCDVNGVTSVGVLVGNKRAPSIIRRCWSLGNATGTSFVGALLGRQQGGTVTTSYFDSDLSTPGTSAAGTGQTTSSLQTPTSNTGIYSAWTIPPWDFGTSSDYPELTTTP